MLLSHRLRGVRFSELAPALFLLLYPVIAIVVHGGASRMAVAAALVAIVVWVRRRRDTGAATPWSGLDQCLFAALVAPVVSVLLVEILRGDFAIKSLDTPLRFLLVLPVFLMLRRAPATLLAGADLSFALGGLGACAIALLAPGNWGGRAGSYFLNPIHFGNIALMLGILSVLSIDWWMRDRTEIRLLKLAGCIAGCVASVLSGARGGWIAVPVIALAMLFMPRVGALPLWKRLVFPAILCTVVAISLMTDVVQQRFGEFTSDYQAYLSGNKDTSTGIRWQLYEAGIMLASRSPLLGLGPQGFHDAMQPLVDAGKLTPIAAEYGQGEAHNQILLFAVDFGILAAIALLAVQLVPGILFWRALRAGEAYRRRAALMGVVLTLSFFVFGMSVEIFNLKTTISFYTTVLAVLLAIALHRPANGSSPAGGVSHNV